MESVKPGHVSFENFKMPSKIKRSSSDKGSIILIYDETLPDSIKIALNVAKDLWESRLPTKQPIYIEVSFESGLIETAMVAEALYLLSSDPSISGYPTALCSQIKNRPYSSMESPDGILIFNSEIDWNCSFTDESTSTYNVTTMALRGITFCLGFGSSIFLDGTNGFDFKNMQPILLDRKLQSGYRFLSDMEAGSPEIEQFVTSDNAYLEAGVTSYKIYAPKQFKPDLSLCYLDSHSSLMSYSIGQGNKALYIDDTTIDILKSIGWDVPSYGLKIVCDDISIDGIGSSYKSHTFSLSDANADITNYYWRFYLKKRSGDFTLISEADSEKFTIDKVDASQDYYVNINGDLEGRIECNYTIDGRHQNAIPFTLSLELKPAIISIDNVSVIDNGNYGYSLTFNVNYIGAENVTVEIEEDYNTTLRTHRIDEPFIAHVKTGNITTLYYSWVTVIVTNKYGTAYHTLEFAPSYKKNQASLSKRIDDGSNDVNRIQLFDVCGNLIFDEASSEFQTDCVSPGVYLKKEFFKSGHSSISKIIIQ